MENGAQREEHAPPGSTTAQSSVGDSEWASSFDARRLMYLSSRIFRQYACLLAISFRWQNGLRSSNAM